MKDNIAHKLSDVRTTVEQFLPDEAIRRLVLRQFLISVDYAKKVAPNAWCVTLYKNMFRLNVGSVEILIVGSDFVRLNCEGQLGNPPFVGDVFEAPNYKTVKKSKCMFFGDFDVFRDLQEKLQPYHFGFIEIVGRRKSGEPVAGSRHKKSHCEDLVTYATDFVNSSIKETALAKNDDTTDQFFEGVLNRVFVNKYERNRLARLKCIEIHGQSCLICNFNFRRVYGPEADGYIHIHHIRPISEIGETYEVNPVDDLSPVCPNCHAVLHLRAQARSLDEVREMLQSQRLKMI